MKTQSTIYITSAQASTVAALHGLDEGARDLLASSPKTDIRGNVGYFLAADCMQLAVLPEGADVALVLSPADAARYDRHVSFPPELRGVVFSGAPRLPKDYQRTLAFWSPFKMTVDHDGAQHVQNPMNEYEVSETDVLLSNGVVLCIDRVLELIEGLQPWQFLELDVPVMGDDMLGQDRICGLFDSDAPYLVSPELPVAVAVERIFLRVRDILDSSNPDFIAVTVLHSECWDSPFYL